jgi:predicted ATPase
MNTGSAPFSGRAAELTKLARCLPTRSADATRVALVAGDAGIGKTRFALELAERAEGSGIVTAYGRCDDEVALPYQPFVAALGELVARAPLAVLDGYARQFGGELARLVPALARRVAWLPPPTPADRAVSGIHTGRRSASGIASCGSGGGSGEARHTCI